MEAVLDKIIEEIETLNSLDEADGGIADVLPLEAVYFGDPYIIPSNLYPAVVVEPGYDSEDAETTGYEKRDLRVRISILIDARNYFDASVEEATGDRKLVQATRLIYRWFRRKSNRTLDGTVNDLKALDVDYRKQERGAVAVKASQINLLVKKHYARDFS